jgi:hypothetical protein
MSETVSRHRDADVAPDRADVAYCESELRLTKPSILIDAQVKDQPRRFCHGHTRAEQRDDLPCHYNFQVYFDLSKRLAVSPLSLVAMAKP